MTSTHVWRALPREGMKPFGIPYRMHCQFWLNMSWYWLGSSGSFDTLAEMISCKNGDCELWKKETNYQFLMTDYNGIQRMISGSTLEQRLHMEGLVPMRADMIVIAVVIINYILNRLIIHDLRLSSYALKEGLIDTLITKPHPWQKSSL